ncbi:MAG: hypothetical protein OEY43_11585 [Gammaproteobacteria bacterium]|nr:hypothetical protein [Gammaproteobacteria bacterium]
MIRLIFILTTLFISNNGLASQSLNLCTDSCRHKQSFILGDDTWSKVQAIFSARSKTDATERQQIARAILLIHRDIDKQLKAPQGNIQTGETEALAVPDKELARNLNEYMALLLDQQLVNRHFIRKTEQRSIFIGTQYASSIQSHEQGDIFIIRITDDSDENNLVIPLDDWKHAYTLKNIGERLENLQEKNPATSNWDDGLE